MPTSPGPTDRSDDDHTERSIEDRSHALIESGCIREVAANVLYRPETTTPTERIDVRQTVFDPPLPPEIVRQLPDYEQLAAVVGEHDSWRMTAPRCTLTAVVDVGQHTWELLVFEITYPQRRVMYSILGRRTDRAADSVTAIIDPRSNAIEPTTAIIYEITTERIAPIPITLDAPLPPSDQRSEQPSTTDIGYHVAIDWFVS